MFRTTIYLPEELHEKLRERAFKERTSMSKLILKALGYLSDMEQIKQNPIVAKEFIKKAVADSSKDETRDSLSKPRGEINGEDYT